MATKKKDLKRIQEHIRKLKFKLPENKLPAIPAPTSSTSPKSPEEASTNITPLVTGLDLVSTTQDEISAPDSSNLDSHSEISHLNGIISV